MKRFKILHILAVFTLIGLTGPVTESARAEAPKATVELLLKTIQKMHPPKSLTPEQQQSNDTISNQALAYMDVRQVSQKALGKYWKQRSKKEQEELVRLLGNLFRTVAFPNSSKFFREMDIIYAPTEMAGGKATVPLTVLHEKEGEVGIDFVLEQNSSRWRVVDVILDGVSMRNNLRTQFYKVLKKHDYAELVRRMQKKLDDTRK